MLFSTVQRLNNKPNTEELVMAIEFIGQAIGLKLPATQKSVLLCLANWANHEGVTYPSTARLAEVAGVSKTTAKRAIRDFLAAGIIQRHYRRGDDGKNQSNVYKLTLDNWTGYRVIGTPYRSKGTPTMGPEGHGDGVTVASNTVTNTVNKTLSCQEAEILSFLNKNANNTETPSANAAGNIQIISQLCETSCRVK